MTRVIVAGGRKFKDYEKVSDVLHTFVYANGPITVVSGSAHGADKLGEQWAVENGWPCERHPADWETYGKKAGYIRNMHMALSADHLIAFWDGQSRGTKHMIDIALEQGLDVHVYHYEERDDG